MLNPAGPVNAMLASVGIAGAGLVRRPGLVQAEPGADGAVGLRGRMVIFSAAMLDVPRELYEAADLDGAGRAGSGSGTSRCRSCRR